MAAAAAPANQQHILTAVVTPASSQEHPQTSEEDDSRKNAWLQRLWRGESVSEAEWRSVGTREKVRDAAQFIRYAADAVCVQW